jgi:cytochrome c-type biogenesis protein CcmH
VIRRYARMALLSGLLLAGPVLAVEPSEMLPDPAMEARARALSTGFRCLVCRNQSIDDSNAELARDLRVLLRERLTAGDTDEQAVAYLVARYGNYILLKPPFAATTVVLWLGPALLLLVALLGFRTLWSGKRRLQGEAGADEALTDDDLTEEDRALIARTLAAKDA